MEKEKKDVVQAMSFEKAKAEVVGWLEGNKFSQSKISKNEDVIETLSEAIQDRRLVVLPDGKLKYTLIEPLTYNESGESWLAEITIKNRINYNAVKPHTKGIKADDAMGLMHAYACALVGEPMSTFTKLDTRDSGLIRSVATFFF